MEQNFWKSFFKVIGCEIGTSKEIQGVSGIRHKILAVGVDEKSKRVVIVQDEQDVRIVAMSQSDIQAKLVGYNVIMVRPVSISLATAFGTAAMLFGSHKFTDVDLKALGDKENMDAVMEQNKSKIENIINLVSPQIDLIQKTKPNIVSVVKEIVQQLSHVKFLGKSPDEPFSLDFAELLNFNPVIFDTTLGICPIPLYEFSKEEAELMLKSKDDGMSELILKKHGIFQFFYPPVDSLALGLIEKEQPTVIDLNSKLNKVPSFGHPFGQNELTDVKNIKDVINALKEQGLAVEGEFSLSITEGGQEKRMQVKFSPRESIFKRLSNIFSIKVDLNIKDFIK